MDPDEFEAPQSPEQAPPSPDYVPGPEYPKYLAPSADEIPVEDQPLLADASPTALSPGYVSDSNPLEENPKEDLKEDPKEDPAGYLADGGDEEGKKEESSEDDEEEEEEASKEDEDEEDHLPSADSAALPAINPVPSAEETEPFETDESAATPPPPPPQTIVPVSMTRLHRARISVRPHTPPSPSTEALIAEYASAPTSPSPPPSLLSPLSSPLLRILSPPLLLPPLHTSHTYASAPLGYKAAMVQLRAASPSTYHPLHVPSPLLLLPFSDHMSDIPEADMPSRKRLYLTAPTSRVTNLAATQRQDAHEFYVRHEDRQRIDDGDRLTSHNQHEHDRFRELARTRDAECHNGLADAGSSSNKSSGNGDDSHDSGIGKRRTEHTTRECTYSDLLKCQPLTFKGIEGVVGLTQWFEKMEFVFHISNCTVACQIKSATCTLLGNALTWWNSHLKTIGHDFAYGMTWKTLKKMMTDKYCPRSEIKKMFPEESDEVEKYVSEIPDMIQGSVMASKQKTMQDAIEFANELMDQKIHTFAERQAENKRKLDDNSRTNHTQQ
ncbi:hypothetical protein Tco_1228474 [Tanacetum coccineum]